MSSNFNPTIVRLRLHYDQVDKYRERIFQSYHSAIKTQSSKRESLMFTIFQSYHSAIKTIESFRHAA